MIHLRLFRSIRDAIPEPGYRRAVLRAGLHGLFLWKQDHWEVNSVELTSRLMSTLGESYARS